MRSLLLAAALLSAGNAFADDEEPEDVQATISADNAKPEGATGGTHVNEVGVRAKRNASGGTSSSTGGRAGGPPPGKHLIPYNSLQDMPHPSRASHGIIALGGADQILTVGVEVKTPQSFGSCRRGESPAAPTDDACLFTLWISRAQGGPPVAAKCKEGPVNSRAGKVDFGGEQAPVGCRLKPGKYWCNVSATGFDHPEQPARICGGLLGSPMMQRP